jgi:hypothetical protein
MRPAQATIITAAVTAITTNPNTTNGAHGLRASSNFSARKIRSMASRDNWHLLHLDPAASGSPHSKQ